MLVTSKAAEKCIQIDLCPSDDLFEVLDSVGEDPSTFFAGGIWRGIDFSKFDMSSVSLAGACVINCIFRDGDLLDANVRSTRIFEGNKLVPAALEELEAEITESTTEEAFTQNDKLGPGDSDRYNDHILPLSLLANPESVQRYHQSDEALEENARMLENVLDDYGVKGEIVSVRPGPVVTMYELEPAPGLKASRVIGLADDIARSMSALSARVSAVPGRTVIGIELPNENREEVVLREILSHRDFGDASLPLALGKDIGGEPVIVNLAKMPHLLIAGTTGSGKSVAINTMILSLLYKLKPEDCRLIMIDPKMLELSVYDGIPHLLSPVVTDPIKAVHALKWTVGEMEERYRKMSKMGVRNIGGYNSRVKDALDKGEMFSRTYQSGFEDESGDPVFETEEYAPEKLPYIVVVVDELADLMMVAGKETEACIQRLAQMARASGIHLIMATQRTSVDVITGTIKANFPTRISFQVTSKIDSRTILGEMGAEQLLGMGDMLYMAGGAKITRCHGPFVSDKEIEDVANNLKALGSPDYISDILDGPEEDQKSSIDAVLGLGDNTDDQDALYDMAVAIVIKDRKCSTSYIQRKLAIGYNNAAQLVDQMEEQGIVSGANQVGKREILIAEQTDTSSPLVEPLQNVVFPTGREGATSVELSSVPYSLVDMKTCIGGSGKDDVVAIVDIGSSKISCNIFQGDRASSEFGRVIGHSTVPSRGVEFGEITDIELAAGCIKKAMQEAQNLSKLETEKVYVCFSGGNIRSYGAFGETKLATSRVSDSDICRALYSSKLSKPPETHEILHAFPVNFALDHRSGISNPHGQYGNRLAADVHVVVFDEKTLNNLRLCIQKCGVNLTGVSSAAYASGLAATVDDERGLGVVCIDFGHESTSISIFLRDSLIYSDTVRMGGRHVTSDLAYGLQCSFETAEKIKRAFGGLDALNKDEIVNLKDEGGVAPPNHGDIEYFVKPRLEEIFEETKARLDLAGFDDLPSQRIVLTGGGSMMPGILQIANRHLGGQVRLGRPAELAGLPKASAGPDNSAVIGLSILSVAPRAEVRDYGLPKQFETFHQSNRLSSWLSRWIGRRP
jgi:cell division protein FtsA